MRAKHVPTGGRHPRHLDGACDPKTKPRPALWGDFQCIWPP